jgi:hypothetical protein
VWRAPFPESSGRKTHAGSVAEFKQPLTNLPRALERRLERTARPTAASASGRSQSQLTYVSQRAGSMALIRDDPQA